jgi:nucleolar complex protein 2
MVKSNKNSKSFNINKPGNPKKSGKPEGKKNFKFKNKNKAKKQKTDEEEIQNNVREEKNKDFEFDDQGGNQADFYLDDKDADIADDESYNEDMSDPSEIEEGGSELDFGEDDYIESEDEDEEEKTKKHKEQKKVTKDELKKLIKKTIAGNTFAMTKMIIIFSRITNTNNMESLDEENALNKPKIINKITKFCIKNLPEILNLKSSSIASKNKKEPIGNLKGVIKRYLSVLTKYLKTAESPMISLMFKYIDNISELVLGYKNFLEVFLKISLRTWGERHGTMTSISALNFVRSILDRKPELFETALKLFYVNYLEIAKAMNWKSIKKIKNMQNEIIEILALDLDKAYLTIFTFIRKLCLQLRATITDKKSSSIKNIYNWQFVNSLHLWGRVVSTYYKKKNCEINLLSYPLIQTIYGVLRLNLVDIFYPLRIVLVNILNELSSSTDLYIPVSVYLFEILESNHFKSVFREKHHTTPGKEANSKKNKNSASDNNTNSHAAKKVNEYDINVNLKLKKEDFKNYGIVSYLLEQTLDSLIEFMALNANRYTFPEMAFGAIQSLKKIHKNVPVYIKS